ncbi:MAG: hypothetical protein N2557_07995, partial [Hydrogenophilus sp.]|nr:hypothetical protein [Hydrogenophilus sp.]
LAPLAPYGAEEVALRIFRGEIGEISWEDLQRALRAISEFKHSSRPTTGYGVESLRYGAREELASALASLIRSELWEREGIKSDEERFLIAYEDLVRAEALWVYLVKEGLLSQEGRIFYNDAADRLGLRGLSGGEEKEVEDEVA